MDEHSERAQRVCPKCRGWGTVHVFVLWPHGPIDSFIIPCRLCDSTGIRPGSVELEQPMTLAGLEALRARIHKRGFYVRDGDEVVVSRIDW